MHLKEFVLSWGMLLVGVVMNVFGIYVVKARINILGAVSFESVRSVFGYFLALAKSPAAVLGAVLVVLAPLPYAIAISRMQLSTAYPISISLNFLLLLPLSILFLGESLTIYKSFAIVLILISLFLLSK